MGGYTRRLHSAVLETIRARHRIGGCVRRRRRRVGWSCRPVVFVSTLACYTRLSKDDRLQKLSRHGGYTLLVVSFGRVGQLVRSSACLQFAGRLPSYTWVFVPVPTQAGSAALRRSVFVWGARIGYYTRRLRWEVTLGGYTLKLHSTVTLWGYTRRLHSVLAEFRLCCR